VGARPNVLLVTLDQLRGDALGCAGHPLVRTPTLDALAARGVRFARHHANAAPCGPGRASLYTGTYQMNHRVVGNGTPLDDRLDNVARVARRAGYDPILFGYTDQAVDPRTVTDPDDPRLEEYTGVLPGFTVGLDLPDHHRPWLAHLAAHGHEVDDPWTALATEDQRPAGLSVSAFLADHVIDWLGRADDEPWFAHVSFLRPHPPYRAAGDWSRAYDPADCPAPAPVPDDRHRLHDRLLDHPITGAPTEPRALAELAAQYYGCVSHVDHELGRVLAAVDARGDTDRTVVVITSDHGEQLGDQGLVEKGGYFGASYHIPAIVAGPGVVAGGVVESFTEAVDVLPTICDLIGAPIPLQVDGLPLTPFLTGEDPPWWRTAAHWEFDWRDNHLTYTTDEWPWQRRLERNNLAVRRSEDRAYVHFGDGSWRCFDLAADPTWGTLVDDPAVVLEEAHALLAWRAEHLDRTLTGTLIAQGVRGRTPPPHPGRPA